MTTADPHPAPPEVFPPTLREVMLRPRWLGVLALCLVVAGVFAWLGQWQLSRAVDMQPLPEGVTEQVQPIDDVVQPGEYLPEPLVGQRVTVTGAFVPDDYIVVSSRYNDGVEGYWVTGIMGQWRVGPARVFLNLENLLDTQQTNYGPVVLGARQTPTFAEIWAPTDGFIANAGVKLDL